MKFTDHNIFKLRRQIRRAIWNSEDAIEKVERDLAEQRQKLAEMESDPQTEEWCLVNMRTAVSSLEQILTGLKSNHARFVTEMRKPSPNFPTGISA